MQPVKRNDAPLDIELSDDEVQEVEQLRWEVQMLEMLLATPVDEEVRAAMAKRSSKSVGKGKGAWFDVDLSPTMRDEKLHNRWRLGLRTGLTPVDADVVDKPEEVKQEEPELSEESDLTPF